MLSAGLVVVWQDDDRFDAGRLKLASVVVAPLPGAARVRCGDEPDRPKREDVLFAFHHVRDFLRVQRGQTEQDAPHLVELPHPAARSVGPYFSIARKSTAGVTFDANNRRGTSAPSTINSSVFPQRFTGDVMTMNGDVNHTVNAYA